MTFEVINPAGVGVMECHDLSCIPDKSQIKDMVSVGYMFKVNGEKYSINKLRKWLNDVKYAR